MAALFVIGYTILDGLFSLRTVEKVWTWTVRLMRRRKTKKQQELKSEKVITQCQEDVLVLLKSDRIRQVQIHRML